ncbi:MAG TPA: hypothetical protein VNB90_10720 [Cytophagaceae bacterium]|nr:hypothetical protein [Cytophagaceae bacterium]
MQKLNYWILGLLIAVLGVNAYTLFSKKDMSVESLRSQNDSLRIQLNHVKSSVDQIDANLKSQLSKVDSSIALSKQSISNIENNISTVRYNLNTLRQIDPNTYYQSLTNEQKEKLKKLMYQDVSWQ